MLQCMAMHKRFCLILCMHTYTCTCTHTHATHTTHTNTHIHTKIPLSEDFNIVSTRAVSMALSLGSVASPWENATMASSWSSIP